MKVVNHTPFATERLRELAQRVAEQELEPNQRAGITVHFTVSGSRTKDAYASRRAGYYRRQIGAPVPGLKFNQAIVTIRKSRALEAPDRHAGYAAHDLAHEFAEMQGYTHEQMRNVRYLYRDGWEKFYAWAWDLPLVLEPKKPAPDKLAVVGQKLANAHARLKTALTREKRSVTLRKKWQGRVAYYQKRYVAAMGGGDDAAQ